MIPQKIETGTTIGPISPNRGIAIFRSDSGGRFIRAKQEQSVWLAITLLEYRGPGLVVFLADVDETNHLQQIGPAEALKTGLTVRVTNVFERHAVGEVVGPKKKKSLEESFNELLDKVDTENGSDEVEFGGELFKKDELSTLLKLQIALYKHGNESSDNERQKDEDGVSSLSDGNNQTSDPAEDNV